ncbi:acetyl-CoA hydrolase [Leucoagaricus gongylophorus]
MSSPCQDLHLLKIYLGCDPSSSTFFNSGKLALATATSIRFSPEGFYKNWALYKDRLLLRSQQVTNSPEIVRRLGVIAMNTPLQVDIASQLVL